MEILSCQQMKLGITVLNEGTESNCLKELGNTVKLTKKAVWPLCNRTTHQGRNSVTEEPLKKHSCPGLHIRASGQASAG